MKSVRASRGKKAVGKQGRRATLDVAPAGYADWIHDVKASVHEARQRAARAVNGELVGLYWRIGRDIRARQATQGWGAKIVDRISADLKTEFPDTEGFSPRNLKYMRAFAVAWPDADFVQGVLAQLPGTRISRSWRSSQLPRHGGGTPSRPSCTAGRATCWSTRSKPRR